MRSHSIAAVVASVGLALSACPAGRLRAPRETGAVRFTNTSGACGHPMAVSVALGRSRALVAPGERVRLEAPAGECVAVIRAADGSDAELARETWRVPVDEEATRFFGCAAPRFVEPAAGRVPVIVTHTPWGCRPGRTEAARLAVDGEPFAQIAPGRSATRLLPPGSATVRVDLGDEAPREVTFEVGAEGGALEVGCAPVAVAGPKVAVLAALGPAPGCGRDHARAVTAAGVTATLAPGEAYTFVLSPGRTRIVTRDDGGAPADRWLDLRAGGNALPGPACGGGEP